MWWRRPQSIQVPWSCPSIALAVGSIIITLTITVSMPDTRQLYWGVNFLKSMLQDLFFSPIIGIVTNSLLLLVSMKTNCLGRGIKKALQKCIDENFLVVYELFSRKVFKVKPPVKKVHCFEKFWGLLFDRIIITTTSILGCKKLLGSEELSVTTTPMKIALKSRSSLFLLQTSLRENPEAGE